jgi:hypothetical protein
MSVVANVQRKTVSQDPRCCRQNLHTLLHSYIFRSEYLFKINEID